MLRHKFLSCERSQHIKPRLEFFKWITSARCRRDRGQTVNEWTRVIFTGPASRRCARHFIAGCLARRTCPTLRSDDRCESARSVTFSSNRRALARQLGRERRPLPISLKRHLRSGKRSEERRV